MTFYEYANEFAGKPVVAWEPGQGIADPQGTLYRISVDYDEGENGVVWTDKFSQFLNDPNAAQVTGLVVGAWERVVEQEDNIAVVEAIVSSSERLPNLTALFLADILVEESEISWIQQSDVSPLFDAFPNLEHLRLRGGNGLSLGRPRHEKLKELVIESGGLPATVVQEVCSSSLPALERLELYLGTDGYGGDCAVEDLAPLLEGNLFPNLKYLGLRDSHIADAVAITVANAPVLDRLEVLDLSLGTLGDEGAQALLDSERIKQLRKLDLRHHYCSSEMLEKLQTLGIDVDVSDQQSESEYGRYVAVSE